MSCDNICMRCEHVRELISASLDGETTPAEQRLVDGHLAHCSPCRAFHTRAAALRDQLAGAYADVLPDPARVRQIIAVAPARRRGRARIVRLLLGAAGLVQVLLGVSQISAGADGHAGHAMAAHVWNEAAAYNTAIGAAFLWAATRRRSDGLIAALSVFLAVLVLLTVDDAASGQVTVGRVASHTVLVAGYVLLLGLRRADPPTRERPASRPTIDSETTTVPVGPLASVHPLRRRVGPAARYRDAA